MQFNLLIITTVLGTTTAMAVVENRETSFHVGNIAKRGCRFIDKQDCNDRYWACQQDSIPSAINCLATCSQCPGH